MIASSVIRIGYYVGQFEWFLCNAMKQKLYREPDTFLAEGDFAFP